MKYKLNQHQKRLPFGGHHFKDNGITFKGDSVDEVADLVENFRLVNGMPIGNPRQEIIDYYALHFPWMVMPDYDATDDHAPDANYVAWRDWLSSIWGRPQHKFLSSKESGMRLETCLNCPHNIGAPWPASKEADEFRRKAFLLRHGHAINQDICFCDLHKADISVASFLETPHELSRKNKDEPDYPGCWFLFSGEPSGHQ